MFKKLFSRGSDDFRETEQQTVLDGQQTILDEEMDERMRKIEGSDMAMLAAELLIAPSTMMRLKIEEARIVVSYMKPRLFDMGHGLHPRG
ncbi:MAG: hypothetical protein HC858_00485 [Brachymonas sp.]|nr:hypothetical protein [Brachymonas sp.]